MPMKPTETSSSAVLAIGFIYDPAMPYLRVSPDRLFWVDATARKNEDNKGILECKTTQLTIDADNLPLHWFAQLQYQLGVAGYREGALAWLTMGREFGHKDIIFDEQFYAYLADQITEYWERYIVGTEEPPPFTTLMILSLSSPETPKESSSKPMPMSWPLLCD